MSSIESGTGNDRPKEGPLGSPASREVPHPQGAADAAVRGRLSGALSRESLDAHPLLGPISLRHQWEGLCVEGLAGVERILRGYANGPDTGYHGVLRSQLTQHGGIGGYLILAGTDLARETDDAVRTIIDRLVEEGRFAAGFEYGFGSFSKTNVGVERIEGNLYCVHDIVNLESRGGASYVQRVCAHPDAHRVLKSSRISAPVRRDRGKWRVDVARLETGLATVVGADAARDLCGRLRTGSTDPVMHEGLRIRMDIVHSDHAEAVSVADMQAEGQVSEERCRRLLYTRALYALNTVHQAERDLQWKLNEETTYRDALSSALEWSIGRVRAHYDDHGCITQYTFFNAEKTLSWTVPRERFTKTRLAEINAGIAAKEQECAAAQERFRAGLQQLGLDEAAFHADCDRYDLFHDVPCGRRTEDASGRLVAPFLVFPASGESRRLSEDDAAQHFPDFDPRTMVLACVPHLRIEVLPGKEGLTADRQEQQTILIVAAVLESVLKAS